jgi:short-subunit dehydrogenase involved in D-alanine esterification of teichoic acids
MIINNKTIVITGGTSGIGYEIVKKLHNNNKVVVLSRDEKKLNSILIEFPTIEVFKVDLSNIKEVKMIGDKIAKKYTSIDLLINNAAIQHTPTFISKDFEYESINKEIVLNFTSICCLTYLLIPSLKHDNKSIILNINSGLALTPKTSSAIYSATKSALDTFSQALGSQLKETNISIQQAFLDIVDTTMTKGRGKNKMSSEKAALSILAGVENNKKNNDIGRVKFLRFMVRFFPSIAKKIMLKN